MTRPMRGRARGILSPTLTPDRPGRKPLPGTMDHGTSDRRNPGKRPVRAFAVLLGLGMLALSGCSVVDSSIPAPLSSYSAPAGVPVADQTNVSPFPLAQRLGKWNGTTFETVSPGSIAGGNLVVLTHGWAAGLLPVYERVQSASTDLVAMWNPELVDPKTGQPAITLFSNLAASIQSADPGASVLMYSWVDQSATDMNALSASAPERATEVNGHRLATALDRVLTSDFRASGGQIHLIGHSFGANVATTAALALSSPPRQLSLFDSPEVDLARFGGAKNDLRYKLSRLDIGRGPDQTFVDNYISLVGEPYAGYPGLGQIVDVRLTPPTSDPAVDKHQYPIGWYANSAESRESGVGLWWSPLMGADPTSLATNWTQSSSDPALELDLVPDGVAPSASANTTVDYPSRAIAEPDAGPQVSSDGATVSNFEFTTDDDSLWLTFTTTTVGSPGDSFGLFIDGRERSVFAPDSDGTGNDGRFLILYDLEPGLHTLSLVLYPDSSVSSTTTPVTAQLSDIRISSTSGIERNLTPSQTRDLVIGGLILVVVVAVVVVALTILLLWWIIRRARRHRHPLGADNGEAVGRRD